MRKIPPTSLWLTLLVSILLLTMANHAFAQTVCAEVKIVIEQKLSFERQAFDAKMVISNGLTATDVRDIQVELLFFDSNHQPITASDDHHATDALFFHRLDSLNNINGIEGNGVIAAKNSAEIHWLIIPSAAAAPDDNTLYHIGAKVTYSLNGKTQQVEVTPDYVVVKPLPLLKLDYFLPVDVYADDPFTDQIEPPVPFTLGVRIQNQGKSAAINTQIESAQPKIVENKQNLLIDFKILTSYIANQAAKPSLQLNFGDIAAGQTIAGRWNMITTLSGKFVEFTATYSHADHLGGALTSLIKEVETHTLIHDVLVELPGRDNIHDFLAANGNQLMVYESEGIDTIVNDQSASARLHHDGIQFNQSSGFVYARLSDPAKGKRYPINVTRSDGKPLSMQNIWLSKSRNDDLSWSHYINLFDVDSTGEYTIGWSEDISASISGKVYSDSNQNGRYDRDEQGIGVVAVTLSGVDDNGSNISVTGYTDRYGNFTFSGLNPGVYTMQTDSVIGMSDGVSQAGDAGGVVQPGKISAIHLTAGINAQSYHFAKLSAAPKPQLSTLTGLVYIDSNENGQPDQDENGVNQITVNLNGEDYQGAAISLTTNTDITGYFIFDGLHPGNYSIHIASQDGFTDGASQPGSAGGVASNGIINHIQLNQGQHAQGYYFAKNTIPHRADLAIEMMPYVNDSSPAQNGTAVLMLKVTNQGPDSVAAPYVDISLAPHVRILDSISMAGKISGNRWTLPSLQPNESQIAYLSIQSVSPDLAAEISAEVFHPQSFDSNRENNQRHISWYGNSLNLIDLSLQLNAVTLNSAENRTFMTISAQNNGPQIANDPLLTLTLPDGVQAQVMPANCKAVDNQVTCRLESNRLIAKASPSRLYFILQTNQPDKDSIIHATIRAKGFELNPDNNAAELVLPKQN